jgi:uncharacterized membrane protein
MQSILVYIAGIGTLLVLDLVWLGIIAKDFYHTNLSAFLGDVRWVPAIAFYLIYILGVYLFVVSPAISAGSLSRAALYGAGLGFLAYATYDLTNLALLKNWPLSVSAVDIVWGTVLTGSVASVMYIVATRLS